MASAHRKTAVAAPQAKIKLVGAGKTVNWPKSEKIPQNIEQALALGWKVTDSQGAGTADELSERGTAHLKKVTARHSLSLKIPYGAIFTHGKPHTPKARTVEVEYVTAE